MQLNLFFFTKQLNKKQKSENFGVLGLVVFQQLRKLTGVEGERG